jgi:hypothetical protein
LATAAEPSEVWRRFPGKTMLAVAGRVDVSAWVEMVSEFLPEDARKGLLAVVEGSVGAIFGKEAVGNLLPNLGPDGGFCVVAPPEGDRSWFPHILAALRVQRGTSGTPADLTLLNALNSLAALAVYHQNGGKPGALSLKSVLQDRVEVRYLAGDEPFPPGVQPAFALKEGYLVVASSPEALRRFGIHNSEGPLAGKEIPLLRLSLVEVQNYLKAHRGPLLAHAAAKNHLSMEEAGQRLDHLLTGLQFFDRLEVSQRPDAGRVIFALRIQMAQPLN